MRFRIWAVIAFAMLLVVAVSCVGSRSAQGPVGTPVPTKTQRPTFTHTPPKPTEVPPTATSVPSATPEAPTMTPEPTAEPPTPTPEAATFTVQSATVNVRSGPGTSYSRIGQLKAGQTFEITGKNDTGDWWQFSYDGDPAWVATQMVQANGAEAVEVAANIPALPTAVKRQAQPAPKPAAPTTAPQPAAPPTRYAVGNGQTILNTNDWITVRCRVGGIPGDSGTMRVMRGGEVIAEQAFGTSIHEANSGMIGGPTYNYNENCKVEIRPVVEGVYTGVLIEGGQPISDAATFTVGGDNREFQLRWVRR
jgi:Bacterial SH3 domain